MEERSIGKEMTSPDDTNYQLKRPLYKQFLFWSTIGELVIIGILLVTLIFSILAVAGLAEENHQLRQQLDSGLYPQNRQEGILYNDHAFGEAANFAEGEKVTVHSIKKDEKRALSDDSAGRAIVVSVTVENTSDKAFLFSPYDFNLFDETGDVYVIDSSTFDNSQIGINLAKGKSITVDLVFDGEDTSSQSWSLVYGDSRWGDKVLAGQGKAI